MVSSLNGMSTTNNHENTVVSISTNDGEQKESTKTGMRASTPLEWKEYYEKANNILQKDHWLVSSQMPQELNYLMLHPPRNMSIDLSRSDGVGDIFMIRFESGPDSDVELALNHSQIDIFAVTQSIRDDGFAVTIDNFFNHTEISSLEQHTHDQIFSSPIYTSQESMDRGEQPVQALDRDKAFNYLSSPPKEIQKYFSALAVLAESIDAQVHLQPFEACAIYNTEGSSKSCFVSFAQNQLNEMSIENSQEGIHQDYNPDSTLLFHVPDSNGNMLNRFDNGAPTKPWLLTTIIYVGGKGFEESHGMGTILLDKVMNSSDSEKTEVNMTDNSAIAFRNNGDGVDYISRSVPARSGRILMFEGDLYHSIEPRYAPNETHSERTSLVFKVILTPNEGNKNNLRDAFRDSLRSLQDKLKTHKE